MPQTAVALRRKYIGDTALPSDARHVGTDSTSAVDGTVISGAKPTGTEGGDYMVARLVIRGTSPTYTNPTGWTLLGTARWGNDDGDMRFYGRFANDSSPNSWNWTVSNTKRMTLTIGSYRDIHTTIPVNVPSSGSNPAFVDGGATADASVEAPSVAASALAGQLITCHAVRNDRLLTPPSGMTERSQIANGIGGTGCTQLVADKDVGSGATGVQTATNTQINTVHGGGSLVLNIAPDPGGGSGEVEEWWNGSAWVTSETFITQSINEIVFPANSWDVTDVDDFEWTAATKDSGGVAGPYATFRPVHFTDDLLAEPGGWGIQA